MGRSPINDIRVMNDLFPVADAAALEDGESSTGAEYLVIAALDLPEGSARRAFERAGRDPDAFRVAVRDQHADALRSIGMEPSEETMLGDDMSATALREAHGRSAPSAQKMFRSIVERVRKERSQLYGAYFVLAATETEHGTTARAIRSMGIEPATLAETARTEIDLLRTPPS